MVTKISSYLLQAIGGKYIFDIYFNRSWFHDPQTPKPISVHMLLYVYSLNWKYITSRCLTSPKADTKQVYQSCNYKNIVFLRLLIQFFQLTAIYITRNRYYKHVLFYPLELISIYRILIKILLLTLNIYTFNIRVLMLSV